MASYKLRKTTVFKRARELSILCDVDVALIMYHPGCVQPEFWCSKPDCRQVINKYLSMNNLPQVELPLSSRKNVKEVVVVGDDHAFIQGLGANDLYCFERFLAGKLEFVNERINVMKGGEVWDLGFDDGCCLTWDDVSVLPSDCSADNNDLGEVCNNDDGDLFEGLEDIVHIYDIKKFSDEEKQVKVGSSSDCVGSDDPGSVIEFETKSDLEYHIEMCAEEKEVRVGPESECVGGGDPDSVIDFARLVELDCIDFGEEDDAFDWTKELMMVDSNDHQPALPFGITC